jgi:hypothetical protein
VKRIRWVLLLMAGIVLVGVGGASVFARSTATYSTNAIAASSFVSTGDHNAPALGSWYWVAYGTSQSAQWTFPVPELQTAIGGTVYLNFSALSAAPYWGSGYASKIKVVVAGNSTASFTTTLANPWRPHVASTNTPGIGWNATATVALPTYLYTGRSTLTVTATSLAAGNHVGFNQEALMIGYATS